MSEAREKARAAGCAGKARWCRVSDAAIVIERPDGPDVRLWGYKIGSEWVLYLYSSGNLAAVCTVIGGKWKALKLAKGLRDAMVSWKWKKRRLTANKRARAAAAKGSEVAE